jgi:hypothetical protein
LIRLDYIENPKAFWEGFIHGVREYWSNKACTEAAAELELVGAALRSEPPR